MPTIIERFYDENVQREWDRLDRHRTEFAVTLRALRDYLPPSPAHIIDIGGGPGRYAIELARAGYAVTLVDLSRNCLEFAIEKAREAGVRLIDAVHADATGLSHIAPGAYDAALLLGPLYRLIEAHDRQQAIREAARVLRPGGLIFSAIITRATPVRWAAKHDPILLIEDRERIETILHTGVSVTHRGGGFTDAYFAHPSELTPLMEQHGFERLDLIACEGVASMIDEQINSLTGDLWRAWINMNYRLGKDPSVHGAAEHVLYVGRKN